MTPPSDPESGAWSHIHGTWRQLHGSFPDLGLSIEWHDFRLDENIDWGRSFHPGSLEICLNFSGSGFFMEGPEKRPFLPGQLILYTVKKKQTQAMRSADSLHRFLTLELAPKFLEAHFAAESEKLKPAVRQFINGEAAHYLEVRPLPASLLPARMQFVEPPVPAAGRRTWYLGRVLEILSQTLFAEDAPGELFCQKHHRTNRERVERVCSLIERDLENPPTLDMLAQEAGCSPFYLSRIFARETGSTIPKFLRMKRIENAAALLKAGAMNVTDAAMAVGYSSLSSFTKAFVEQMGCCPGLYPIGKLSRPAKSGRK